MSFIQVIKTELYKNSRRKSSMMLFIPMILAFLIAFGYSQGFIKLNLTVGTSSAYSCMDFIFIVWNVLSGLGIMGILLILFAAFEFSGEIERGQIKLMLLRIGKRDTVIMGKYVSTMIAAVVSILGVLISIGVSYYLFVASSNIGTGTFASTISGLSTLNICASLGMQILMYFLLISITFIVGLFANPFITFILTMIFMYAGNYLGSSTNPAAKLLPVYWSNQLMTTGKVSVPQSVVSICFTVATIFCILYATIMIFRKRDVK